jgi:hypothetical protein
MGFTLAACPSQPTRPSSLLEVLHGGCAITPMKGRVCAGRLVLRLFRHGRRERCRFLRSIRNPPRTFTRWEPSPLASNARSEGPRTSTAGARGVLARRRSLALDRARELVTRSLGQRPHNHFGGCTDRCSARSAGS